MTRPPRPRRSAPAPVQPERHGPATWASPPHAGPRLDPTRISADARLVRQHLRDCGPMTYGAAAHVFTPYAAGRAWAAQDELLRAGLIRLGPLGVMVLLEATP